MISSDYKTCAQQRKQTFEWKANKNKAENIYKTTSDKKLSKCISNSHNSTSKNKYVDLKYGQEAQMITFSK
jgi:hypothetical protein